MRIRPIISQGNQLWDFPEKSDGSLAAGTCLFGKKNRKADFSFLK